MNNIEEIYKKILKELNREERESSEYFIYVEGCFIRYRKCYAKNTLSLLLKIKENRKNEIDRILEKLDIDYKIVKENSWRKQIELVENKNYLICEYVCNSHIVIPQSFLKHFADKNKIVNYIDMNTLEIKEAKVRDFGAKYGYYSKYIENYLSINFESRVGIITKILAEFGKGKMKTVGITKEMLEDIYSFFDIVSYRNPKMLEIINKDSFSTKISGEISHDDMLRMIKNMKLPHIYQDLEFNIMVNKTERNFVINETMITDVSAINKKGLLILPINYKECLCLMNKEYYQEYIHKGYLYYISIEQESIIEEINKEIFKNARREKENIIGSRVELEKLLKDESRGFLK